METFEFYGASLLLLRRVASGREQTDLVLHDKNQRRRHSRSDEQVRGALELSSGCQVPCSLPHFSLREAEVAPQSLPLILPFKITFDIHFRQTSFTCRKRSNERGGTF